MGFEGNAIWTGVLRVSCLWVPGVALVVGAGLKKNIVIDPSETRAYLLVGAGGDLNAPEESCARYCF